ncbi:MAG: hypothetical protein Q7U20_10165 [Caulobacter sp.]|nr:hypothetical protein [Caulobacter sp.]
MTVPHAAAAAIAVTTGLRSATTIPVVVAIPAALTRAAVGPTGVGTPLTTTLALLALPATLAALALPTALALAAATVAAVTVSTLTLATLTLATLALPTALALAAAAVTAVTAVAVSALTLAALSAALALTAGGTSRLGPARATALALPLALTLSAATTAAASLRGALRRALGLAAPTPVSANHAARAPALTVLGRGLGPALRLRLTLSRLGRTGGGRGVGGPSVLAPVATVAPSAGVVLGIGRRAGQKRQHERGGDGLLHLMLHGAGVQPVLLVPLNHECACEPEPWLNESAACASFVS